MSVLEEFKAFVFSNLHNRWPTSVNYVVQDSEGMFVGFVEKPDFVSGDWISIGDFIDLGLNPKVAHDFDTEILTAKDVFPLNQTENNSVKYGTEKVKWNPEGSFPPVGQKVSFWYESDERGDEFNRTYREGVVVYSSEKGATVDIGFLVSSGEKGDFEYSKQEQAIEQLSAEIAQALGLQKDNMTVQNFAVAVLEGKVPSLTVRSEK